MDVGVDGPMMPSNILSELEQRVQELRRDVFGGSTGGVGGLGAPRVPPIDVIDNGDEIAVVVDLPGIDKKDIKLDVDELALHVRGQRQSESEERRHGYVRRERTSESFERHVALPEEVSPEGAVAKFKDGVLRVTIPKAAPEKRRSRPIEID